MDFTTPLILGESGVSQIVPLRKAIQLAWEYHGFNPGPIPGSGYVQHGGRPRIYTPEEAKERKRVYDREYFHQRKAKDPYWWSYKKALVRMRYADIRANEPERYQAILEKDRIRHAAQLAGAGRAAA
ncbi:MAG: hypothetical protein BWY93_01930 [Euryarchaeota archaeon ADurb.BinA087]|nr:MAG: hypothetical protein BWY93_01930 [Euryarchaeota archaeon ADurb.BinA087]